MSRVGRDGFKSQCKTTYAVSGWYHLDSETFAHFMVKLQSNRWVRYCRRGPETLEDLLNLLWHVPTVMVALLLAGLLMGPRHVGELSVFDLLAGIAIGSVAGAGIVNLDTPHLPVLASILGLGVFHWIVTTLTRKSRLIGKTITFEPTIVIQHGKPLRESSSLAGRGSPAPRIFSTRL